MFFPAAHNVSSKLGLNSFFFSLSSLFFNLPAALAAGRFKLISLKSKGREFSTDVWQTFKDGFNLSVHMPCTGYLYWGAMFFSKWLPLATRHSSGCSVCQMATMALPVY